jgi:hypothetical protein
MDDTGHAKHQPVLVVDTQAEDAALFCVSVFKHSETGAISRYGQQGLEIQAGGFGNEGERCADCGRPDASRRLPQAAAHRSVRERIGLAPFCPTMILAAADNPR